ncbi:DUF637 domain-containing protein, partial [Pseudomonas sp. Dout3]
QNSDYSLYDMKKKGSWGSEKTQRDEVTQVTNIGSEIKSGGDLTLKSGGDQRYQVATLQSGKDLTLDSGGSITFEAVKDLHDESHTKSDNDAFWNSSKGEGKTDETLRQSSLIAAGNLTIKAVDGLKIDIKHIDQKSVSQTIDAMVKADPQLAWLKQAEARGDVDWRQVKEIHESFKYNNSGLGPAAQLIIAIALAAVMGPMMAGMNSMLQAVSLSVATKATVSTIDNRGNLGKVVKDVTSKESIKGYTVAAAMAGVADGLHYNPGKLGFDAKSLQTLAIKVTADAAIKTAVYGGSFKDNLASAAMGEAVTVGGAVGAGAIGGLPYAESGWAKVALHAALGGLMAEAMGGDFRTGALAAGANQALVEALADKLLPLSGNTTSPEYQQQMANLLAISKVIGVLGAVVTNGDVGIGAAVAGNSTQYNYLGHAQLERAARKLLTCTDQACITDTTRIYQEISFQQDLDAVAVCMADRTQCAGPSKEVANTMANLNSIRDTLDAASPQAQVALQTLINSNHDFQGMLAAATTENEVDKMVDSLRSKWNLTDAEVSAMKEGFKVAGAIGMGAAGALAYKRAVARIKGATVSDKAPNFSPDPSPATKGAGAPNVTIKDHYDHHLNMVDDIKDQLSSQGFRVSEKEISFGSSCGTGRCRPDIVAEAPDGTLRIIEVKTGSADLSIRQSEIFPQIKDGSSIPRGKVAESFGLKPGVPLKEQGYPNGIPIEIMNFPGAK